MNIYTELPTWHVEAEDYSDKMLFWFRGQVTVEAYPDDEWHYDTLANIDELVEVYSYADAESEQDDCEPAMIIGGEWEILRCEGFGGTWIGPISFEILQQIITEGSE